VSDPFGGKPVSSGCRRFHQRVVSIDKPPCVNHTQHSMIRSFADSETATLCNRNKSTCLPQNLQRATLRKLRVLKQARELRDLASPGNRLEKHREEHRKGEYSVRIDQRWSVCFEWRAGHAFNVEVVDCH